MRELLTRSKVELPGAERPRRLRASAALRALVRETRVDPAQLTDVAEDGDPQLAEQELRQGADGHPQRRLAGAGALQHLTDSGLVVDGAGLERPRPAQS